MICKEGKVLSSSTTRLLAEAPITKSYQEKSIHLYSVEVLCARGALGNEDPQKQEKLHFMLGLPKSGESCRSMIAQRNFDLT